MKRTITLTEQEWSTIHNVLREAESKRLGEDYPTPAEEKVLVGIQAALKAVEKAQFDKTFIEAYLAGEASLDNLDDYIEYWHTHDTGNKLHEFLGLTSEEYARWLKVDAKEWLQDILDARGEAVLMGLIQTASKEVEV